MQRDRLSKWMLKKDADFKNRSLDENESIFGPTVLDKLKFDLISCKQKFQWGNVDKTAGSWTYFSVDGQYQVLLKIFEYW